MLLKEEIRSHVNPKHVYGVAGEEIKILSENDGVAIVEKKDGKTFPCRIEKLTLEEIEIKKEEKIIIKPERVANRPQASKPVPPKQSTLFL